MQVLHLLAFGFWAMSAINESKKAKKPINKLY
jgi:hypothetical protein